MTAPAAPIIYGRIDDGSVAVRWQPVVTATDYKLYAGPTTAPTALEDDIPDDDIGPDGWFSVSFVPDELPVFVRLTALNVGAEESAYSNELNAQAYGGNASFPLDRPNAPASPSVTRQPFG